MRVFSGAAFLLASIILWLALHTLRSLSFCYGTLLTLADACRHAARSER
jgi:hypothetical protein